jgi:hypothetical protein
MNKACDTYLATTAGDQEAALALWSPSSLDTLLFALSRVRIDSRASDMRAGFLAYKQKNCSMQMSAWSCTGPLDSGSSRANDLAALLGNKRRGHA